MIRFPPARFSYPIVDRETSTSGVQPSCQFLDIWFRRQLRGQAELWIRNNHTVTPSASWWHYCKMEKHQAVILPCDRNNNNNFYRIQSQEKPRFLYRICYLCNSSSFVELCNPLLTSNLYNIFTRSLCLSMFSMAQSAELIYKLNSPFRISQAKTMSSS